MSIWSGWFGQRNVKLSEPAAWHGFLEDRETAGQRVNSETMLGLSTAWSCIRLLSETVGTLPIAPFQQEGSFKQIARDHYLYPLLHDSPNADQSAAEFWEGQVACLCTWGNGYSFKSYIGGRLVALTPLRPDIMNVYRDSTGARRYRYGALYDGRSDFGEDEILHIRGFGFGGDVGLSPISYNRTTLGTALAANRTAANMFANGLQLSGFVETATGTKLTKEVREQLVDMFVKFSGSAKAGKVMPLDPGMKFTALGMNPEDAQLLETRAFHVEEICRIFRVPPSMVGHAGNTSNYGTGLEQQNLGFLTYSLQPYLTRIEQALQKQVLAPADRKSMFIEFNLDGLLRADSAATAALFSSYAQNGIMTRNEMRSLKNLPKMAGGDDLTVQVNLLPVQLLGTVAKIPNEKPVDPSFVQPVSKNPASLEDPNATA